MKKGLYISLLLIVFILSGCEKVIDWNERNDPLPLLVVDGRVTNERIRQEVTLSRPATDLDENFEPVSNAAVAIIAGNVTYPLHEDNSSPGKYYTDDTLQGVVGKVYILNIRLDGKEFTASAYMVPAEPLGDFLHDPCGSGYKALFSDQGDPYIIDLRMDWSGTSACSGNSLCEARIMHYYLNTIDVNQLYNIPETQEVCFPKGTRIIRKKYSLTPEYQEFLRTLLTETSWRGGLFDVESGNVITNLSNGAVGYFSASTVISDTITVR